MTGRCCIALLLLAAFAAPAHAQAWTWGDTLTTIQRPLPNLPAFARPGDTLTVWVDAPASAGDFRAALLLGAQSWPLAPAGGGYQQPLRRWVLGYRVPADAPFELHDLVLTCNAAPPDTSRHAVKVLPAYRTDFYFAQISDTHLPTHVFSSNGSIDPSAREAEADFAAVAEDLNLIHPEFVLHAGDLVNEGELEDYLGMFEMGRAMRSLLLLRDPVFVVTGNHDIGGWDATAPPDGTARKNWWRQFGWKFLADPPPGEPFHSQNFSFDYGRLHVVGLEAYLNVATYDSYRRDLYGYRSFTPEQMGWLAADLAAVPADRAKLVFYHYDFGGPHPDSTRAAERTQIQPGQLGVDGVIWGHNHGVPEGAPAARPFDLGLQAVVDGNRAFRIFRFSNGRITPGFMHKSGGSTRVPLDSLRVSWSAPNDGTNAKLTAQVTNEFDERWEHGRLSFQLADRGNPYTVTGGAITQVVRRAGVASVTVELAIPARGNATVTVEEEPIVAPAPVTDLNATP